MIVIIPARGGSKGVPRKNIRKLAGKPALFWTVQACLKANAVERVFVSTEDSEIRDVALASGAEVPVMRPDRLASDTAPNGFACLHLVDYVKSVSGVDIESFALVQATSPLLEPEDIDGAISLFHNTQADSVVSVVKFDTPIEAVCEISEEGYFRSVMRDKYGVEFGASRRQDYGERYAVSGGVSIVRTDMMRTDINYYWANKRSRVFVLDPVNGHDIDTPMDFELADTLMLKRLDKKHGV